MVDIPKQYPPGWDQNPPLRETPPSELTRRRRNFAIGANPHYEYGLGHNLFVATGKVHREPTVRGAKGRERVWFRICVPNQDRRGQWLFLPVSCSHALATHVYENISKGDIVAVVGRLWTGRITSPKSEMRKVQFTFCQAERVSCAYPVQLDLDPRYVRVRQDVWARAAEALGEVPATKIPEKKKQELLDQLAQFVEDADDAGDDDPPYDPAQQKLRDDNA